MNMDSNKWCSREVYVWQCQTKALLTRTPLSKCMHVKLRLGIKFHYGLCLYLFVCVCVQNGKGECSSLNIWWHKHSTDTLSSISFRTRNETILRWCWFKPHFLSDFIVWIDTQCIFMRCFCELIHRSAFNSIDLVGKCFEMVWAVCVLCAFEQQTRLAPALSLFEFRVIQANSSRRRSRIPCNTSELK